MNLKDKIATLVSEVPVEIQSLQMTVKIRKLTLKQAIQLQELSAKCKDSPVVMLLEIASKYIFDEDGPLIAKDDSKTVESLPVKVTEELLAAFASVNEFTRDETAKN